MHSKVFSYGIISITDMFLIPSHPISDPIQSVLYHLDSIYVVFTATAIQVI